MFLIGIPLVELNAQEVNNLQYIKNQKNIKTLEKQKEDIIESVKEQLKQQGKLKHFKIYKDIIEQEYEIKKQNMYSTTYSTDKRVYAPNGGSSAYIGDDVSVYAVYLSTNMVRRAATDLTYGSSIVGALLSVANAPGGAIVVVSGLIRGWYFSKIADDGKAAKLVYAEDIYGDTSNVIFIWNSYPYIVESQHTSIFVN